ENSSKKATGDAGNILIKAKDIRLRDGAQINSSVWPEAFGNGGNITVEAEDTLKISGYYPVLIGGVPSNSGIVSDTHAAAKGGKISISAETLTVDDNGVISASTVGSGDAGNVSIRTDVLALSGGGQIKVSSGERDSSANTGHSGKLTVKANKSVLIVGHSHASEIKASGLFNNVFATGNGGETLVSTPALEIRENGTIQSAARGDGNAGNIVLNVDTLHVHQGGFITTDSAQGTGRAGDIEIHASRAVTLAERNERAQANISSKTLGRGNAGNIVIRMETGKLSLQNNAEISTGTKGAGDGGKISVYADEFRQADKSRLSASSQSDGNAGNLVLQVNNNLSMRDNSSLQTSTEGSDGGDIFIASSGYLRLIDSEISTSVKAEDGDGGNISLVPQFILLDGSKISADASRGNGGNVIINTTGVYNFSGEPVEQVITAHSERGIDGVVRINSPDADINDFVVPPAGFLKKEDVSVQKCEQASIRESSRFTVGPLKDLPVPPDDLNTIEP
ncbi:MAG: hypothetical protein GY862_21235, partial [Gammaproteobacteria bacterium]|nr:hypothetical protein [Gammaproteobacteria bacterium]